MLRSFLIALLTLGVTTATQAADRLVVHEWGTFTSLQDEHGNSLGRINTDDEPVPAFVHQLPHAMLFPPTVAYTTDLKGTPAGDPNVTMRLETPVIYFHPPKGDTAPMNVDVDVAFNGGWLSQYFPDAHAAIDGAGEAGRLPVLTADTVGRLAWHGVTINSGHGTLPLTDDAVWTAPRAVFSAMISSGSEAEHFLFYRGVGHVDSPLRVERHENEKTLEVHASNGTHFYFMWLVDIRPDGAVAFCRAAWPGTNVEPESVTIPSEFSDEDYSPKNLDRLRELMHKGLVYEGLFSDEADALLNTWQRSYFQNPGERLLFLVPQSWTERVLPLKLSVPADVKRVMVGRIELVTPPQRALLRRMAAAPMATDADFIALKNATTAMSKLRNDPAKAAAYNALAGGHGKLEDLGVPVPAVYADFLALGRFRTALLLNAKEAPLQLLAVQLVP